MTLTPRLTSRKGSGGVFTYRRANGYNRTAVGSDFKYLWYLSDWVIIFFGEKILVSEVVNRCTGGKNVSRQIRISFSWALRDQGLYKRG